MPKFKGPRRILLGTPPSIGNLFIDTLESYADAADLNNLGGFYVDRFQFLGLQSSDDLQSYADAAALDGLNGGTGWTAAYVDREQFTGLKSSDDMQSYTDTAALDGLNGGSGWTGGYVDRAHS